MASNLMAPPIRTGLINNPDGTPLTQAGSSDSSASSSGTPMQTEKSWYYYWRDLGRKINGDTDKLNKLVTYGAHADRGDPANMPDGAIYIETDRGAVYQNLGGVWQYITGTMWATLAPDLRPTDLGVNDAGFDFRTTDQPAREFIWSQTEWIEATPVRYGTHAARLAVVVAQVIDQMLWVETDRGAIYQLQAGFWQYIAGTMWGTFSPDQRPTDLGTHDAGFDFRTTDAPPRQFIWSQTAWVEVTPPPATPNNSVQIAYASAGVTLTTTAQTIPGTALTLAAAGSYLVTGTFFFNVQSGDSGQYLLGSIPGGSADAVLLGYPAAGQSLQTSVSQQWVITVSAGATVSLQASKTGGSGASTAGATHTSISALWVSP